MKMHISRLNDALRQRPGRAVLLSLCLLALVLVSASTIIAATPTFSITGVVVDQSVSITTSNFPANQNFTVTMGLMGTQGINGVVVGTTNSGNGGSFSATYSIPDQLKGMRQIAIRLQSPQGYFSYNWFNNNTTGGVAGPPSGSYTGIPTFDVVSVVANSQVTIRTTNFPANRTFTVRMGMMGTQGVNGTVVGTLDSGAGGTLTAAFNIPAHLQGASRIAIRAESGPYFAYNWFSNSTAGVPAPTPTPGPPPTPAPTTQPPPPVYTGIPTFTVCGVVRNQTVTIRTNNFPPNQTFSVTMGPMGSQGIGGTQVGTINSGAGGTQTVTFNIPAGLQNAARIAIRAQSGGTLPYFAYNWFYNATATVC